MCFIYITFYWIMWCNWYRHILLQIAWWILYNKLNIRRHTREERTQLLGRTAYLLPLLPSGDLEYISFLKDLRRRDCELWSRKKIHLFPDWSRSMLSPGATGDRHSARTNNAAPWFHVSPGSCIASFRFALLLRTLSSARYRQYIIWLHRNY